MHVASGGNLLSSLANADVFLPSACGGKGSCAQCRVQVMQGGGEVLPTETVHLSRREVKDHWRLACQVKVRENMAIDVPASVLSIKEWECTVISNRNVATFIKEFIVALPPGEHMDFIPGSYAQIKIPPYTMDYDKDIDKAIDRGGVSAGMGEVRAFQPQGFQQGDHREGLLDGKLSRRGRPHHADCAHSHSAYEAETADRIHGRASGHRIKLHIFAQTG